MNGRDHSEDLVVDGRISKWILGKQSGGHLAQDRKRWLVLVNTLMNLRVPHNA
jgi:hypothetical protein